MNMWLAEERTHNMPVSLKRRLKRYFIKTNPFNTYMASREVHTGKYKQIW